MRYLDMHQSMPIRNNKKISQTRTIPPNRNATTCLRRLDAFGNAQSKKIKY
jgi:hypothetical protein